MNKFKLETLKAIDLSTFTFSSLFCVERTMDPLFLYINIARTPISGISSKDNNIKPTHRIKPYIIIIL